MSRYPRWTDDEIALLYDPERSLTMAELCERLPRRSEVAIKAKLIDLGLTYRKKHKAWTTGELRELARLYPNTALSRQSIADRFGVGVNNLTQQAQKLGLRRVTRLDEATTERVRRLAARGHTVRVISHALDVTLNQVRYTMRREGMAHPLASRLWTDVEDALLSRLAENGMSNREIANRLGRGHKAVTMRRRKLLGTAIVRRRWSAQDIEEARRLARAQTPLADIAAHFRTNVERVRSMAHYRGIDIRLCQTRIHLPWTEADLQNLHARVADGISIDRIAEDLGRTQGAIASKITELRRQDAGAQA